MYATLANLKTLCGDEELIQLTDRAVPPSGDMDLTVITAALVAATGEIDGYVAAQYKLPLAEVPPQLVDLASDIARYRLYKTAVTDQVRQRYEDAVKTLEKISKGVIKLPIAPGATAEPAGRAGMVRIASEPRQFSRSSMRGM